MDFTRKLQITERLKCIEDKKIEDRVLQESTLNEIGQLAWMI